ncbi:TRAP transporter small permease [Sneathiella aquimaris]|uniref:TRAP transporter small permease n=1 Tax=Sneathiella aquimaris TaxID=2599305 RepID=UPI00146B93C7|nr:TRAP transporter small permease subunit [Sneathiella aquimaris]
MKMSDEYEEGGDNSPSFHGRALGFLAKLAAVLSAVLIVFTLAITGYSVLQRYVFGTPLTWTDELSGFLVVAIVMLGAAETLRKGEHISVDLLSSKARGISAKILGIWGYVSTAFVAGVLLISGWAAVEFSWNIGVYSDGYLEAPLWIPQSFLLVGGGLLMLLAISRAIDLLVGKRQK